LIFNGIARRTKIGSPVCCHDEQLIGSNDCNGALRNIVERILDQINPEILFARDEDYEEWCLEQLEAWRELYLLADERGEEILVGVV
jgi:hypothetical protein